MPITEQKVASFVMPRMGFEECVTIGDEKIELKPGILGSFRTVIYNRVSQHQERGYGTELGCRELFVDRTHPARDFENQIPGGGIGWDPYPVKVISAFVER